MAGGKISNPYCGYALRLSENKGDLFLFHPCRVLCGLLSLNSFLSGSWLNLVFWGVVGLTLGFFLPAGVKVILFGAAIWNGRIRKPSFGFYG